MSLVKPEQEGFFEAITQKIQGSRPVKLEEEEDEVLEVLNVKIRVVFDVFNEFAGSGDDDVDLLATLNDVVFVVFRV